MTRYELLKANKSLLETLHRNSISTAEVRNIALYERYRTLITEGFKRAYIIATLCDEYALKERAVYTLLRRFDTTVVL